MKNYIVNGRVAREEIASDICEGILSRKDIEILVNTPEIYSVFIGKTFMKKREKYQWDSKYLETLPNVAVAEAFNEDYLYYLADVAEYVRMNKSKKTMFGWMWLIAVIVLCIAVLLIIKSRD